MLGILTGLESEAAIARTVHDSDVACAGARPQNARWLARALVQKGATRLLSFGVAGALEPGLPLGSLIIGTHVASVDHKWDCDVEWVRDLTNKIPQAHCGGVFGSETLIASAREKRIVYERSRCLIVDMESQCAAQIAAEAKIPFIVLRAVCDSSTMEVPPVLMAAVKEDGGIDYLRAAWNIIRHPKQIPHLFKVSHGMNKAVAALKASVSSLGST
jgi:hopanoid-associated phosphorylase